MIWDYVGVYDNIDMRWCCYWWLCWYEIMFLLMIMLIWDDVVVVLMSLGWNDVDVENDIEMR